jgi:hypothetical protein
MQSGPLWVVPVVVASLLPQNAQPTATGIVAQNNHGIVLILSRDPATEAPDSGPLKACLAHNAPADCVPLIVVLKNEGKETLLRYSATCAWMPFKFDFKMLNANWAPIPPRVKDQQIVCESTVGGYSGFPPGCAHTSKLRLADLGYALPETGSHTIRASTEIGGCVASERVDEHEFLENLMASIKCVGSEWPKQALGEVQSNELEISASTP